MLSEELRNLALWLRARRQPVDVRVVVRVLDELVLEAERLEANTRLTWRKSRGIARCEADAAEIAERVSREGLR